MAHPNSVCFKNFYSGLNSFLNYLEIFIVNFEKFFPTNYNFILELLYRTLRIVLVFYEILFYCNLHHMLCTLTTDSIWNCQYNYVFQIIFFKLFFWEKDILFPDYFSELKMFKYYSYSYIHENILMRFLILWYKNVLLFF